MPGCYCSDVTWLPCEPRAVQSTIEQCITSAGQAQDAAWCSGASHHQRELTDKQSSAASFPRIHGYSAMFSADGLPHRRFRSSVQDVAMSNGDDFGSAAELLYCGQSA